jgi:hypothetical protein
VIAQQVFIGIIAVSVLTMAVIQVGAMVMVARLIRRIDRLTERVDSELKPLFAHLDTIGREAARAASVAAAQVDRVDGMLADLAAKVDETASTLQATILKPVRESRALLSALRAALAALRASGRGEGRRGRAEDEDALFI